MKHPTTNVSNMDTEILEEAIQTVYERPKTHGKPENSFATIAQMWSSYLGASTEEGEPYVNPNDVANMMILLKVARNAEGHYHKDNYTDIAGYAENGANLHL